MSRILTVEDLTPFGVTDTALAAKVIDFLERRAFLIAPCLKTTTDQDVLQDAAAILIQAALRWTSNAAQQEMTDTSGPFSYTIKPAGRMLLPDETDQLRALCAAAGSSSPGMPRGNFPTRPDYEHLFAEPGYQPTGE